ncbi:hypothetical protein Q9L42_014235 [Methylomarinum sp. Ch1-1]|uniref:Transposase n=1 Tax=Methylomarinum roseum TaxID=3067653 RepID=A0AAU7NRA9_9GAMM
MIETEGIMKTAIEMIIGLDIKSIKNVLPDWLCKTDADELI